MRRAGLYWRRGNQDAFVADWVKHLVKMGQVETGDAFLTGYRKAGMRGACTVAIELLKKKSRTEYVSPFEFAKYYAAMGDHDHAFEWLERGFTGHSIRMEYIKTEPLLDGLRTDPRYVDLLRRMGLSQ